MTSHATPHGAVLHVRISDDPEGLEKGVDRQEADCRSVAEAHGFENAEVFRENDTSAFKLSTITLPTGEIWGPGGTRGPRPDPPARSSPQRI